MAKLIDLPAAKVEIKLSQMILDKLFAGEMGIACVVCVCVDGCAGAVRRVMGNCNACRGGWQSLTQGSKLVRAVILLTDCLDGQVPPHSFLLSQARWTRGMACWRCGSRALRRRSSRSFWAPLRAWGAPWSTSRTAPSSWSRPRDRALIECASACAYPLCHDPLLFEMGTMAQSRGHSKNFYNQEGSAVRRGRTSTRAEKDIYAHVTSQSDSQSH